MVWLILVAIGTIVGLITWASSIYARKRREAFAKRADQLGLDVYFDLPEQDWDRLEEFELYKKHGRSQRVEVAVIAQTDTTRVVVCEYTSVVGSGKNKSTQPAVVLLVTDKRLALPQMVIARRTWTASIAKWVGYRYIEFPDDPDFNSQYLVRGESEEAVRSYLDEVRRRKLVASMLESFETLREHFIVVHRGTRMQPSQIEARIAEALAALKAIL